jgi:anhydro-N-acetylmuramic acid kinase
MYRTIPAKSMKNNFNVIGVMSGTSLDGLDIAFCEFTKSGKRWSFNIHHSAVIRYPASFKQRLSNANHASAQDLMALDADLGKFIGNACYKFIQTNAVQPDFIASHGHTIFHQPQRGFTTQIGNGNAICAVTGIPVICDFRSLDVVRNGQGAPLVPAGDRSLFADHDICLNLGGIANLSAEVGGVRKAFDICFCNMPLNYVMNKVGREFDRGGVLSSTGKVNEKLLHDLQSIYRMWRKKRPSLGREQFDEFVKPLLDNRKITIPDKLATVSESAAMEIVAAAETMKGKSMLCTGGGAFNSFLISRILHHAEDAIAIVIPENDVVKFKEALVFAFLGVLRFRGETNCLSTVTGASRDSSGGVMIGF